ncbi:MFS transporter, partial [Mesorhizobium sp. M7A.F.Ca.CA.004.08.1.1]
MDQPKPAPQSASKLPIPRWEFIALCAALMALNSLAIDIMLPALQQIGATLGVENENHRQYVITAYILGFGGGQLFFGPISDRFGRRAPLVAGLVIYVAAAAAAAIAPSFETLLLCRAVQGIGAAATRVIAVSIVRDTFDGRRMAEVMSLIFMVFMAIPVIAPGIGQFIMLFATWHWIFVTMAVGALLVSAWSLLRLPETLHPEHRRPLTLNSIVGG